MNLPSFEYPDLTVAQWMTQVKTVKSKRARTGSPCDSPVNQSPGLTDQTAEPSHQSGPSEVRSHNEDPGRGLSEEQCALLRQIYLSTWETVFG